MARRTHGDVPADRHARLDHLDPAAPGRPSSVDGPHRDAGGGSRLLNVTTATVVEVTLERLVLAGGNVDGNDVSSDPYVN